MKMRYNLLLTCLLFLISAGSHAQQKWAGFGIETNVSAGKIFRHSKKFPTQLPKVVTSHELNFVVQTHGTKPWQQRRKFPQVGFGIMYTDYGIDSIYGRCVSIYPNLQIPLVRTPHFEWVLKAAFGLGYITQRFDRYPDFDTINTAIGTHFNNFSLFATDLRYRINEHFDVQVGGNFSHVSNAAFRTPNLGINSYGAHIGMRYFPVTSKPEKTVKELEPLKNRWLIQARFGMSAREAPAPDGPTYPVYLISAFASKRYWSKNKLWLGVDYSYHSNIYYFLRDNEIVPPGEEKSQSWKSAVFVGNEFLLGRVGILFQVGVYLKNTAMPEAPYYEKLGGNFYLVQRETGILKELSASILLKTHLTEAELVEVGIGVGF